MILKTYGNIIYISYAAEAFEPILVVGNGGNKYNVIPADQFK